ncbi:MAG TPA: hypothetical protein VF590_14825, partial [Isosphaeraceae bacterium]
MNGNVGASFALSFLLVGVAAVVLYRPDPPPPRAVDGAPIEVTASPEVGAVEPLPPLTPTVPGADSRTPVELTPRPSSPRPVPTASPTARIPDDRAIDPIRRPSPASRPDPPVNNSAAETPTVRPAERTARAVGPRRPFTTAAAGETIEDVAR